MPAQMPHQKLMNILAEAYRPCAHFGTCPKSKWAPEKGYAPGGFLGATSELSDVKVVFIFSEPGAPYEGNEYEVANSAEYFIRKAVEMTYAAFSGGTDLFHRNAKTILAKIVEADDFDTQMRHAWMTEARLCTTYQNELGQANNRKCAELYLKRQLELLPNAFIIPFGGPARSAINSIGYEGRKNVAPKTFALAPPGANLREAKDSWGQAVEAAIKYYGQ